MGITKGTPICPKCNKGTNREFLYMTSTLIYSPVMIDKDGNTSYHDPNTVTYTYLCHECGTKYSIDNHGNVREDKTRYVSPERGGVLNEPLTILDTVKWNGEDIEK